MVKYIVVKYIVVKYIVVKYIAVKYIAVKYIVVKYIVVKYIVLTLYTIKRSGKIKYKKTILARILIVPEILSLFIPSFIKF